MRVRSAKPVIVRSTKQVTQEQADHIVKAMKPFGRKVILLGPESDVEWPAPPPQRQSRHAREIRIIHELGQQVAPEAGLRAVGEG